MCAATLKSMWDEKDLLMASSNNEFLYLIIGNVVAFIVAYFAIKSFIGYLNKHGFKMFGYYRIILGLILIILLVSGVNLQIVD